MLELKEGIKKASEYFELMYEAENTPNKLLEEIEYDDSSDTWNVVIGFDSDHLTTRTEVPGTMFAFKVQEKERKYKQIRLKGEDGSFVKMVEQML